MTSQDPEIWCPLTSFFFGFAFFLTLPKRMDAVHFFIFSFLPEKRLCCPPLPFPKTMLEKTQTPCPGAGPSGVSVFSSMVLGTRQGPESDVRQHRDWRSRLWSQCP
jgi:hypothetical protein